MGEKFKEGKKLDCFLLKIMLNQTKNKTKKKEFIRRMDETDSTRQSKIAMLRHT